MNPFRVICIDSNNKPNDIPTSKWIKKGQEYTVIEVSKMRVQGGMLEYKLEEVNIDSCFPYQYFSAKRFAIFIDVLSNTEAMLAKLLEEAKKEAVEEPQPA